MNCTQQHRREITSSDIKVAMARPISWYDLALPLGPSKMKRNLNPKEEKERTNKYCHDSLWGKPTQYSFSKICTTRLDKSSGAWRFIEFVSVGH